MVALPQNINVEEHAYQGSGIPFIDEGQYQAVAVTSEMKKTANGQAIVFKIIISQGEYAGTEFNEYANIINSNDVAVKAGYSLIANIGKALGLSDISDTNQLHNKPFFIEIKNVKQDDWFDKEGKKVEGKMASKIKKYLSVPTSGSFPFGTATPAAGGFTASAAQAQPSPFAAPQVEQEDSQQVAVIDNPFAASN
jgi:hypothetical protein